MAFKEKLEFFSTVFLKNPPISDFIKIRPVRGELFHVGGPADT
jgi:hypothetical protein